MILLLDLPLVSMRASHNFQYRKFSLLSSKHIFWRNKGHSPQYERILFILWQNFLQKPHSPYTPTLGCPLKFVIIFPLFASATISSHLSIDCCCHLGIFDFILSPNTYHNPRPLKFFTVANPFILLWFAVLDVMVHGFVAEWAYSGVHDNTHDSISTIARCLSFSQCFVSLTSFSCNLNTLLICLSLFIFSSPSSREAFLIAYSLWLHQY